MPSIRKKGKNQKKKKKKEKKRDQKKDENKIFGGINTILFCLN